MANREEHTVDSIDMPDTDDIYIKPIADKISKICNGFINRNRDIDVTHYQGLTEMLKDVGRKAKPDINNIKELDVYFDIYAFICCKCRIKPTLLRFAIMTNISRDTFGSWMRGEFESKVASGHSSTCKKWKADCESTLYDEVISTGNIGCMFALKACHGYKENQDQQINVNIGVTRTVDQIAQDYAPDLLETDGNIIDVPEGF